LKLLPVGKRPVMVATEQRLVDFYLFRLGIFPSSSMSLGEGKIPYVFAETDGFLIHQTHNFDVLLGMDVLQDCNFELLRDGNWSLSFG